MHAISTQVQWYKCLCVAAAGQAINISALLFFGYFTSWSDLRVILVTLCAILLTLEIIHLHLNIPKCSVGATKISFDKLKIVFSVFSSLLR